MAESALNKKAVFGAALAGMVAGVITGILIAPKSGKETRADIARIANKIRHDIMDQLGRMSDITSEAYRNVVSSVTQKYEDAKEITKDQADQIKNELDSQFDEVKRNTENRTRRR